MSNRRICKRLVGSVSVTVVGTVLVINIPEANYDDCEKVCLAILQEIPTTATRGMQAVVTIGTSTIQYPLVKCNGTPVTQEYVGQGNIYRTVVRTTSTSAIFKVLDNLCSVCTNLMSIPAATDAPAAGG